MSDRGRVLVTGAGRRVGAAIAARLAKDGWAIALHCRSSRDATNKLAAEIGGAGGCAEVLQADLRDEKAATALCDALAVRGDWVGLVNSAASFAPDDISSFAYDAAAEQLRLNLIAPVYVARRLAAALPANGRGFVTNIADQKILNPNPDFLSYTLSKLGLAHATGTLAMALAPRVRVNCIAPGLMLPSGDQTQENFQRVHDANLLKRGTTPEDVADACAYLAGAENVTGALIAVDGGQHLVPSARDVMFD
jgi:NAD(P)-dependent dehydrogenase (short-subunit alcohol dehydrogenase family)